MRKPIEEVATKTMDLYDSETGKSLISDKIVEATHLFTMEERVVIKYSISQRGPIAQICAHHKYGDKYIGSCVHYFLNEMTPESLAEDSVFKGFTTSRGAKSLEVARFIYNNR